MRSEQVHVLASIYELPSDPFASFAVSILQVDWTCTVVEDPAGDTRTI